MVYKSLQQLKYMLITYVNRRQKWKKYQAKMEEMPGKNALSFTSYMAQRRAGNT